MINKRFQLWDYQLDSLNKMHNGCILCGGVGSGKSLTAISYYYLLNGGDPLFLTGKHEFKKLEKSCELYIITTAKKRDSMEWESDLLIFLLFGSKKVTIDSWNNIKKYKDVHNAFFIFDEQRVVGYGAWAKTFVRIARQNQWILLTATPGDKWIDYIPVFMANGFYKNKTEFYKEHVLQQRFGNIPIIKGYINTKRLERLRDRILVDMEYKKPSISHDELVVTDYDKIFYKGIVKSRWNPWTDKPIKTSSELCACLRRAVSINDSRPAKVLEILEDYPRAIIFYNYDFELEILRNLYYGENVEIAEWNGHKHQEIPDCDKWVYLVQYNAGAEGWNCIKTNCIIFYSPNYSYKIIIQARGRIDRLNTPYTDLYYYHLRSYAPIDCAVLKALKEKKKFNEGRYLAKSFKIKE